MSIDPRIEAAARALASRIPDLIPPEAFDHVRAVSAAMDRASIVTTVAELDALPELSVVLDSFDDVSQKRGGRWCGYEMARIDSQRLAKYGPLTIIHRGQP